MRHLIPVAVLGLGSLSLVGCSSGGVDASCAVDDVTHEVEHIVEEAFLTVDSVDELRCSGDWAVISVTLSGEGDGPRSETLLFRLANDMWILKSAELVCDPAAGDEAITGDLADEVCNGG